MPTQVQVFPSITIPVPFDAIYRRLGYKRGITQVDKRSGEEIERHIDHALSLISLKGAGRRVLLRDVTPRGVVLETGGEFRSGNLARFLKGCREVLLMGATAGDAVMESIRHDTEEEKMTRGVVIDAAASELADAALDWIAGYHSHQLTRENSRLTQGRFSAGYGDFLLENQMIMHDLLELDRIGVGISESCILIPEKSVTAVMGIQR